MSIEESCEEFAPGQTGRRPGLAARSGYPAAPSCKQRGTIVMSGPNQQRKWQLRWHEILNDYPDPDGGASETPDPLPDLDSDFRLHFNLWQAPWEARRRAFALLPCGDEMLARVDRHLCARRVPLSAEQAIDLLRSGLRLARQAGVRELPAPDLPIDVLSASDVPLLEVFMTADNPFRDVADGLSDGAMAHHGTIGSQAYFFLSEPLYRLRASCGPANWVRWPLCSNSADADLTEASYLLEEGGWSAGWTGEKLFIFDRREEFGLNW